MSNSSCQFWNLHFQVFRWKFAIFLMSFLKVQVSFPSNVASIFSAIKHNSPILFLAQTLYTLFKRSPLKCKFLRFLSARVKICQIPHVNFELTSQFLFKFGIILHCHDAKLIHELCFMTMKSVQSLKKNWLLVPKMTWGIWWILMQAVASLKICTLLS